MNDWKSYFLWKYIRIGMKNAWAILRKFQEIKYRDFRDIIANWLINESSK
jgi:hypothetical protein